MQRFICLMLSCFVYGQYYNSFTGEEINRTRYEDFERVGLVPVCAMRVNACDVHEPRRMDLSCNNLRYPPRGAAFTPFARMLPPVFAEGGGLRRSKSGNPLPPPRALRVALMTDGRRPHARFTHMLTNMVVFIAGDTTSVHDTVNYVGFTRTCCQPGGAQNPQCMPIEVRDDDLHLRRSNVRCMNLTRAITYQTLGCVPDNIPPERINMAAPMLELSVLYGHEEAGARQGREFKLGRMGAEIINGKEWPPSGGQVCVNNVPPRETRCHAAPSPSANSLPGINLVFMWFYRSHNAIAAALRKANPCWDDNKLYFTAREINIAYCNQITYYEMMPELFGWEFLLRNMVVFETSGHVEDYVPRWEPRLTIEYSAATRWFHTMQEGTLNLYKPDGRLYGSVQVVDMILRTGALPLDGIMAGMTQGSFRQPGGALDQIVDPDIGERILGRLQFASDVIASDIMKGRDFGLPPYNRYRKTCGLPEANKFKDLLAWMDRPQVEALASFYEHPDDIDLLVALLAEKPMSGGELGPTLACIMAEQLVRWRRADRFWYEHSGQPGAFTLQQLREIRKMTLSKLLCQHGDSVDAVQPRAFLLPGDGNEITSCAEYDMPDLSVFRDERCYPHPTPNNKAPQEPTPSYKAQQQPTPSNKAQQLPTPSNKAQQQPTPSNKAQQQPTPSNKAQQQPTPSNKAQQLPTPSNKAQQQPTPVTEHTTLKDYLTQVFDKNQYKLLSYPNSNPYSVEGYLNDLTLLDSLNYNRAHSDRSNAMPINYDSKSSQGRNPKDSNHLFPNGNPKVNIYHNADRTDPESREVLKAVSIPAQPNSNSKSSHQNVEYHNIHPAVRNQNYPFEEFLQNYWQSSNANPFDSTVSYQ